MRKQRPTPMRPADPGKKDGRKKVLVVDDDSAIVDVMTEILGEDFEVFAAASAVKALSIARLNQIDLVILDIRMPMMDGFACLKELKSDPCTQHIPVIMCTVLTNKRDILHAMNLGASDYIIKPFRVETVEHKVERVLTLK